MLIVLAVVLDPNKNLRTPFNWLIVNMAVADLVVGILTDPSSVFIHMRESLGKKISNPEIIITHMSFFISCTASVLSISSLAVERYLAVRKPNTYRTRVTNKRIIFTVAGIWLISLSLPNIYFQVGSTLYAFIFVNASVFVAISITCLTYTLMWRKIKGRSQEITRNNGDVASPSSTECETPQSISRARQNPNTPNSIISSAQQTEAKVTQMFLVVLIAMFCCYVPATILIYLMNFCESCGCLAQHWFRDLQSIFILTNSSLNFCCYALQSSRFRSAFIKILKIKKANRRQHREVPAENVNSPQDVDIDNTADQNEEVRHHDMVKIEMTSNGLTNKGHVP
ncbi:adenosine receptor A2a-like, partial [Paramuricea clavata]